MRNQKKNTGTTLDQFFAGLPRPSLDQMEGSRLRVVARLQREDGELSLAPGSEPAPVRSNWKMRGSLLFGAAAMAIMVLLLIPHKPGAYATIETGDGSLKPGQQIHYGDIVHSSTSTGDVIRLVDGSRVEMRADSEISLKPAADGLQIRLNSGSVIINAATQGSGHLYVQTRDCVVSVVGTVFLVTADATGSRVAVIQGEVHVQQGTTMKALLPGEQLSTASSMTALPVGEAVAWSRFAASHLELLKQSVTVPVANLDERGAKPIPDSAAEKPDAPPALIASLSPPVLFPPPTPPMEAPARVPSPEVVRVPPKAVVAEPAFDNRPLNTLKVNVEMVQVYTSVTDAAGRFVTNLKPGNFKISEDGKDQQIEAFSSDDSPLSVGILFDVNGLMGDNLPAAKEAALSFLKAGNFANEYFVLEFNDKPTLTVDYTGDLSKVRNHVPVLSRSKESGALDAIYAGLEKLRSAKNPRRVLFVFTTGGNLKNEHKVSQVRTLAAQLDVQILGLSIADANDHGDTDGDTGMEIIDSVGGEVFVPNNGSDFLTTARKIAVALRNQYILGYKSTNAAHDGKYRRLKVKLAIDNAPDLFVHTRGGYYASMPER